MMRLPRTASDQPHPHPSQRRTPPGEIRYQSVPGQDSERITPSVQITLSGPSCR